LIDGKTMPIVPSVHPYAPWGWKHVVIGNEKACVTRNCARS
jgi:hypothetical protein